MRFKKEYMLVFWILFFFLSCDDESIKVSFYEKQIGDTHYNQIMDNPGF